jgi:hypothetical protein
MELTEEQLDMVIGGTNKYLLHLKAWKNYISEAATAQASLPSGVPSSQCPQESEQIGFLDSPGSQGEPVPRCVRDGATINDPPVSLEEDFQDDVKKRHKRMKIRLLKKGGNKVKAAPYNQDPSMERAKSAPPGFGGS